MYSVIVVDDEPAALRYICKILKKNCSAYQIVATAENGNEALRKIEEHHPDLLITDVKMPGMDGVELVREIKASYPDMFSIIISGHHEFAYVQGALRSGAVDYILKPVPAEELQQLLARLESKLDSRYYEKRMQILRQLCTAYQLPNDPYVKKVFPNETYRLALIRVNALPRRFGAAAGNEVFAAPQEKMNVYGRDIYEALCFLPQSLLGQKSFRDIVKQNASNMHPSTLFYTAIICEEALAPEAFARAIQALYRKLEQNIRVGQSQILFLNDATEAPGPIEPFSLDRIETLVANRQYQKIKNEITYLFGVWEKERRTQLWVEEHLRRIIYVFQKHNLWQGSVADFNYMIDDAFACASSMQGLCTSFLEILQDRMEDREKVYTLAKEELFAEIENHINWHLDEALTVDFLCKKFGLSQTTLNKMFRLYGNRSFGDYVTNARIEKAKVLMLNHPERLIKDVAEQVGYTDPYYFSRIFKTFTGIPPSEYIKSR